MKKPSSSRRVLVEPAVHEFWERPNRHRFELGFLVGQSDLLGRDDLVLAAVEVPSEEPDLDHDIEIVQGFDDLSVEWVVEIATQIDRLLPGGIDILGLYVVALADAPVAIDQAMLYMRAIAAALALPAGFALPDQTAPEHHCVVHIGSATSVKTARSFANVRDAPRTSAAPAELQSPSSDARLKVTPFRASVVVDETVAFRAPPATAELAALAETRLRELTQQLKPLAQRVWLARGVASASSAEPNRIELASASAPPAATPEPSSHKQTETGRCRGTIECVAFVPANEPRAAELAALYLKRDCVRSLLARVALLRERLTDDDAEPAAGDAFVLRDGGLLRLPRRGLINWRSGATPSSDALQLSVLALAEDDDGTVVQNALEILSAGDELPGLDIDRGIESLHWLEAETTPGVALAPSAAARSATDASHAAKKSTSGSSSSALFVVLPLLLLLLALLFAKFQ